MRKGIGHGGYNMNNNYNDSRIAAQKANLEALLNKWLENNPGGSILRDVKLDTADEPDTDETIG